MLTGLGACRGSDALDMGKGPDASSSDGGYQSPAQRISEGTPLPPDAKTCRDWGGNLNLCTGSYPAPGTFSCKPQPLGEPGCQGEPGQPASEATRSYPVGCTQFIGWCLVYYPCLWDQYECVKGQGNVGQWVHPG